MKGLSKERLAWWAEYLVKDMAYTAPEFQVEKLAERLENLVLESLVDEKLPTIPRILAWANRVGNSLVPDQRPWHSNMAHWGLSMVGSDLFFWLGRIGSHGWGLTSGTVAAWWIFIKYKLREHRQKRDGMEFERGDLAGPLANAVMWSVAWGVWIYYSLN